MTRTLLVRAALALLFGWGVWAGHAQSQGPDYYPRTPPQAAELPPGYPPVDSSPSQQPVKDWWQHGRPLGCFSSFNNFSCSSLRSELGFIFGSCRTFYSEPCLKGAPPSPLPPWAGPESGYHINPAAGAPAAGKAGCPNCGNW